MPEESLVGVPIGIVLPLGSIAVKVTRTPVAFVGIACCMNLYSIQADMLASEIAGVPWSEKSKTPLVLRLPEEDWSVTVPVHNTVLPKAAASGDAATVVALGPLPKA